MKPPAIKAPIASDSKVPNAETRRAMDELEQGKGNRFPNLAAMFKALGV